MVVDAMIAAVQVGYAQISRAVTAALQERGLAGTAPQLAAIGPPRAWGVSTSICFVLGPQLVATEIAAQTEGLDKKERKKVAARLGRDAGIGLAVGLAEELSKLVGTEELPFVSAVEAEGAYINFYYDVQVLAARVVKEVLSQDAGFGKGRQTGRTVMVEYAQPNTHKEFHVGHLRNASIGQAIANLLEFAGNEVLRATYIGDVGKHVALAIWFDRNYEDDGSLWWVERGLDAYAPSDLSDYWGGRYAAAKKYESWLRETAEQGNEDRPESSQCWLAELEGELSQWLASWEAGQGSVRQEWQSSRDACIEGSKPEHSYHAEGFRAVFQELGVQIDPGCWFCESAIDDTKLGQNTAGELKRLGIAEVDESPEYRGAWCVDLERHADNPVFAEGERERIRKLGKVTILRSDGTSLYQTKELGLAKHKFDLVREERGKELDESLYVVGAEQKLYFEQVFAILRLWGFPNAENCRHISYELVVLPEGKMSSREGNVVSYRELRDEAVRRAVKITSEKGIAGDVERTARDVALGAIKFAMLEVTANQQIVFDFERALSFTGRAAPYLQYAYARAGKLVDESAGRGSSADVPGYRLHPSEVALAQILSVFPSICSEAAAGYEPAALCAYLYELASAFSDFYRDCRVLDAPRPENEFRRDLTAVFRRVMRTGFGLLAMPLPEEM